MDRILIAEDDEAILELIRMNLQVVGYACTGAEDGAEALRVLEHEEFDLALLDIMLPTVDGWELLGHLKKRGIPVIFVSAKNSVYDRVQGLKLGAEDYLVKPFEILELLVRVEKVLARTKNQRAPENLRICGVEIDEKSHTVLASGVPVALKPLEFSLLLMFARHPNIVLTRQQLLREVWGDSYFGETRTVDIHVAELRRKLGWKDVIRTVHRIGYKLEVGPK